MSASDLLNIFLFRPDLNLAATIQALQQNNVLQILAEPNLLTASGKEASFLAGGEFPFPVVQGTAARRLRRNHDSVQGIRRASELHAHDDGGRPDSPESDAGSQLLWISPMPSRFPAS